MTIGLDVRDKFSRRNYASPEGRTSEPTNPMLPINIYNRVSTDHPPLNEIDNMTFFLCFK